jgi:death-on-curing protein
LTVYLAIEDVLEIHRQVMTATGGPTGVRDLGLLESAVARPAATFGGLELYEALPDKAAALLHSLVKNHPFLEGNKRTGFTSMDVFLRLNGWLLVASENEKYDFVEGVAAGAIALPTMAGWIDARLKRASTG